MEHQVLFFGKNFKKSQLHINTHTEARNNTERKDSKRKTSKTEDPILIYGDRVYSDCDRLSGEKKEKRDRLV